jgi:hypothetical protein
MSEKAGCGGRSSPLLRASAQQLLSHGGPRLCAGAARCGDRRADARGRPHRRPDRPRRAPRPRRAARDFASPAIRNRATVGGNVAKASPAAGALIALGARAVLRSSRGAVLVEIRPLDDVRGSRRYRSCSRCTPWKTRSGDGAAMSESTRETLGSRMGRCRPRLGGKHVRPFEAP